MTYRRRQKTISAELLNEAEAMAVARRRGELGRRPDHPADFYSAREDGKIVAVRVVGADFNKYDVLPLLGPDGSTPTPSSGSNQFQGCSGNPLDSDEFQRLAGFIEGTSTYNGAGTGIGSAYTFFAVLLDQIKSGEVGPAKISGHFAREITVNAAHHRFARMTARSPNTMGSALSGPFRIKARHNNLGGTYPRTEWVILEANAWQPGLIFEGKSDAAIAKGATGTVSVWDGYTGTFADTTENVTVTNRYGAISAAGKVLEFKIPVNAAYYSVSNAEC